MPFKCCNPKNARIFEPSKTPFNLIANRFYSGNSGDKTHPVGQKQANNFGLYDMTGNVWEWCEDGYGNYPSGTVTNPTGSTSGSFRVIRGGSWIDNAEGLRSAYRGSITPSDRGYSVGFRLLRTK